MLKMGQFSKVLLAIDNKVHTVPHHAMDCWSEFGGLHQVYGPNYPTPSA